MLSFRFVGTMMFMSDIFPMLDKFSRITQGRGADVDLGVFFRELPLLLERLQHMADHPEESRAGHEHFGGLQTQLDEWTKGGNGSLNHMIGLRKQFCLRLIAHLTSRTS
jgi:hypothetical protein